ncbi:methyl-accepting chemotaxis protein, partial [Wenzhouxiangella sp. XN24]|nr:methyl-accepting chemotaxis protein [Wenzhouxiangella sp. XN24]
GLAQAVSVFRIDEAKLSGIAAPRSAPARAPAPKATAAKANGAAGSNGSAARAPARKAPKPAAVADVGEEWSEF